MLSSSVAKYTHDRGINDFKIPSLQTLQLDKTLQLYILRYFLSITLYSILLKYEARVELGTRNFRDIQTQMILFANLLLLQPF